MSARKKGTIFTGKKEIREPLYSSTEVSLPWYSGTIELFPIRIRNATWATLVSTRYVTILFLPPRTQVSCTNECLRRVNVDNSQSQLRCCFLPVQWYHPYCCSYSTVVCLVPGTKQYVKQYRRFCNSVVWEEDEVCRCMIPNQFCFPVRPFRFQRHADIPKTTFVSCTYVS